MLHDFSDLYINHENFDLAVKLEEHIASDTLNAVEILRRVRSVLIQNNLKFETFTFNQLEDALIKSGLNKDIVEHVITGLSTYFDELQPIDFIAIEKFEKRLISLDITEQFFKK